MNELGQILIIEDNAGVRDVLVEALTEFGYRVYTAADGEEGVRRFRAVRPDLVLLDLWLPRMVGEDVLTCLRLEDPDVPVVIVSANNDIDLAKHLLTRGAFDYVRKPCDVDYLERVVSVALASGARSQHRESA